MTRTLTFTGIYLMLLLINPFQLMGQSVIGEFSLHGIMEMASGFRFTEDGKFDFYYVYGAVDREASGTYMVNGDTIKLTSNKEPGKDFPIKKEEKKGKGYTIKIVDANTYLVNHIRCMYFIGEKQFEAESNKEGIIRLDVENCDKIYLQHGLFPDIATLIKDKEDSNNSFEVGLSPSLVQVSFKGIDLFIKEDELTCLPNYFMPFENIRYQKL